KSSLTYNRKGSAYADRRATSRRCATPAGEQPVPPDSLESVSLLTLSLAHWAQRKRRQATALHNQGGPVS
ncbi:MAG TPA: hypothetical protein VGZ22_10690, partial [Isosphaeraceae bacterium]|nr:hypothetical protein [Isosphaeraceae bacterium]